MNQEKKEWMKQTAAIVRRIVEKNPYSKEFAEVDTNNPFFSDACNYVALVYELREFYKTLENIVKYSEMYEIEKAKQ